MYSHHVELSHILETPRFKAAMIDLHRPRDKPRAQLSDQPRLTVSSNLPLLLTFEHGEMRIACSTVRSPAALYIALVRVPISTDPWSTSIRSSKVIRQFCRRRGA